MTTTDRPSQGEPTRLISRRVVELTAQFTGRGPVSAVSHFTADCVTVILDGVLSKGEQNLVEHDQGPAVEVAREAYEDALRTELVQAVEQATGRTVRTLLSASDVEEDLTTHVFVFTAPVVD